MTEEGTIRTFHRGTSQQKSQTNLAFEFDTSGLNPEALKELSEYFVRVGRDKESSRIMNEEKADRMRKLREDSYRDVKTLLKKYRGFKRAHTNTLNDLKDNFTKIEEFDDEGNPITFHRINADSDIMPFTAIAQRLELMSASEEKKFMSRYFPQIELMERMEVAMQAVDSALAIYSSEKGMYAEILRKLYVDGDEKPTVAAIREQYDVSEQHFYRILSDAIEDVARIMFGGDDKEHISELRSICARFNVDVNAIDLVSYGKQKK